MPACQDSNSVHLAWFLKVVMLSEENYKGYSSLCIDGVADLEDHD